MNTIEDFENAPIGAIATLPGCPTVVKIADPPTGRGKWDDGVVTWTLADLAVCGYQIDPLPSAPKTAREALALAWELAHPVKEGQEMPEGSQYVHKTEKTFVVRTLNYPYEAYSWDEQEVRTLDPLPDPEPDWLDAPAIMAHAEDEEPHVWVNVDAQGWQDEHGNTRQWTALRDVTPLWPKEQES